MLNFYSIQLYANTTPNPKIRTHFLIKIQLLFSAYFQPFQNPEKRQNSHSKNLDFSLFSTTLEQPLKMPQKTLKNQPKIIENTLDETLYK